MLVFFLYKQSYLVSSMLFACSYYTLMLKEAEVKIYHTCFSEILFFFFLSFFFYFYFPGTGRTEDIFQLTQGFHFELRGKMHVS